MKYQYCRKLNIKLLFDSNQYIPVIIKSHGKDQIPFLCEKELFDKENHEVLVMLYLLSLNKEGYFISPTILTEIREEEDSPIPESQDTLIVKRNSEYKYRPIVVRTERKDNLELLIIEENEKV